MTRTERRTPIPAKIAFAGGYALKKQLEKKPFTIEYLNIHKPYALANGGGKRIQNIHSRDDPFRESIVSILGLLESRDLVSQDSEDSLRGIARLKVGKERVRGQIFLGFTFVRFQSGVENGNKVRMRGGCGGGGGHDGSWKKEG
jgi:hypothetical protein